MAACSLLVTGRKVQFGGLGCRACHSKVLRTVLPFMLTLVGLCFAWRSSSDRTRLGRPFLCEHTLGDGIWA